MSHYSPHDGFTDLVQSDVADVADVADADAVLVLTEWDEFRSSDPAALRAIVGNPAIIDARNCLDAVAWRRQGGATSAWGPRTKPNFRP